MQAIAQPFTRRPAAMFSVDHLAMPLPTAPAEHDARSLSIPRGADRGAKREATTPPFAGRRSSSHHGCILHFVTKANVGLFPRVLDRALGTESPDYPALQTLAALGLGMRSLAYRPSAPPATPTFTGKPFRRNVRRLVSEGTRLDFREPRVSTVTTHHGPMAIVIAFSSLKAAWESPR